MPPLTRRSWIASLAQPAAPRPNIILILADDLAYGDLGCFGQKMIATPNLDRLAAEGMRFTQAYAGAAVCAPSRCALMTGRHLGHARIRDNKSAAGERVSLEPQDVTVAELLKSAGYATGIVGKWGIGEAGTAGVPNAQGFDDWYGFLNQDHALDYYPNHLWDNQREVFPHGNQGIRRREYAQDLFTQRALAFIDRHKAQPFFLYAAYTLPHASGEIGRDTGDGYIVPDYGPYEDRPWPKPEKGYAAMVHRLDRDVGRILDRVRELGLDERTLILFASDNGGTGGSGHQLDFFQGQAGFRGDKGTLYEGGLRTPAIARWPGRIRPGAVNHQPWAFWDFLPTAAALAGVPPPPGVDGISILPALLGEPLARREPLYWEAHGKRFTQAIREGRWKAVRSGGALELFDLEADPGEKRNLADTQPAVAARLGRLMDSARVDSPRYPMRGKR